MFDLHVSEVASLICVLLLDQMALIIPRTKILPRKTPTRHLVYHSHNHGAFRIGLEIYSDAIIASLYNSIIYIIVCTSSAIMDTAEGPGLISIGMSIRLGVMCQILAIQMLVFKILLLEVRN